MAILTVMEIASLLDLFGAGVTPLVRTDFTDDRAWSRVVAAITAPVTVDQDLGESGDYEPNITPVDDREFDGIDAHALAAAYDADSVGYLLLADSASMAADG